MGRYKCAYNCENSSDPDVKFFKFPLYNPRKLKKWLANMKWKDWTPSRFSVLCMDHFEEWFIDRSGKSATLREDAVPTIFSSSDNTQRKTASTNTRRKRQKTSDAETSEESSQTATSPPVTAQSKDLNQTEEELLEDEASGDEQKKPEKWRIVVDERLMKIDSFPHFFHGDYCAQQNIHWAPDDNSSTNSKDCDQIIEVNEPWQWLGLDVRGPLTRTPTGHRYILTVTDYFSRWVEAAAMPSCLPSHVAKSVADIVAHLGYPVRILSRLPHDVVHRINRELKERLKVQVDLVVHHPQTGTVDWVTPQMIDRMVSELSEQHEADWDVYLPAKVFSLCFKEHSATKQRPFSLLCCSGREPVHSPRGLDSDNAKIQKCTLVIK
ncbi:uncharacterized protein LOC106533797 [Austrofundulus limnaeus]|uniref:THAP domain-containing protein 1 n=1 Tax=Austrofundulus limnaeus TaxID=52670 RepID=A0A2I4D0B6_AUSLI|nr:PREDICTED: uncharacterized protein LOC106533797 [Austrofundulus limnaeus]